MIEQENAIDKGKYENKIEFQENNLRKNKSHEKWFRLCEEF